MIHSLDENQDNSQTSVPSEEEQPTIQTGDSAKSRLSPSGFPESPPFAGNNADDARSTAKQSSESEVSAKSAKEDQVQQEKLRFSWQPQTALVVESSTDVPTATAEPPAGGHSGSFRDIMAEQEEQQREEQKRKDRNEQKRQEEEQAELEMLRLEQEKEMVALAMEMSLRDFNYNAAPAVQTPIGNMGDLSERTKQQNSVNNDSMTSFREEMILMENERTETVIDSPHKPQRRPVGWMHRQSSLSELNARRRNAARMPRQLSCSQLDSSSGNPMKPRIAAAPAPSRPRSTPRGGGGPLAASSRLTLQQQSPHVPRRSLLGANERTEIVINSPHADIQKKRTPSRRLQTSMMAPPLAVATRPHMESAARQTGKAFGAAAARDSAAIASMIEGPPLATAAASPPSTPHVPPAASIHSAAMAPAAAAAHRKTDSTDLLLETAAEHLSEKELLEIEQALRSSERTAAQDSGPATLEEEERKMPAQPVAPLALQATLPAYSLVTSDYASASAKTSPDEVEQAYASKMGGGGPVSDAEAAAIEQALREADEAEKEAAAIEQALREAEEEKEAAAIQQALHDEEEAAQLARREQEEASFQLALQMQQEEHSLMMRQQQSSARPQGNVRVMTRSEFQQEQQQPQWQVGAFQRASPPRRRHPLEEEMTETRGAHRCASLPRRHPLEVEEEWQQEQQAGFRMNANAPQQWSRVDRNTIVGPDNEVRTKHDTSVQNQANAQRLGLDIMDETGAYANVGNTAFNSFRQSMNRNTMKGVASHGTGRAGSDTDTTRGGVMDTRVRDQLRRAVNTGLINKCNGAVQEGKEAIVFHAEEGEESGGYDVAVKIFKRTQDFRNRGQYVEGDPRYARQSFGNAGVREQLEIWAEKEFRNLTRANRARVPVPSPLMSKENILFMRFIGEQGWPAPQLRELNLRAGSRKWSSLYVMIMEAVRKLYVGARLVHGDLSEYNILAAQPYVVENQDIRILEGRIDIQPVLIDFGQSVDIRHPEAMSLLRRDVGRVRAFFILKGAQTMGIEEAMRFVTQPDPAPER